MKIEEIDIETSKIINKSPEYCAFSRKYNPIKVLNYLRDLGFTDFESQMRMKQYHKCFYEPIIKRLGEGE